MQGVQKSGLQSFNTQPPEGGWELTKFRRRVFKQFQHTAARRRLGEALELFGRDVMVSTHSRPKAAGSKKRKDILDDLFQHTAARRRLVRWWRKLDLIGCFNTQPPEGGWEAVVLNKEYERYVSTHSRPKAAGASLKSLAPSGFAALISLSSQEKREREYNTAFSVTPTFAIS